MNIVVFSLGIVFDGYVQGGSQKNLYALSKELGKRGHTITILCPFRTDNKDEFEIFKGVVVKPVLPLKGTFPMPYNVSPFAMTRTCEIIDEELKNADLFYCHDGGLNIEYLKGRVPTVISLRDFCYCETLLGALNFNQDAIIVNSDHTYNCLIDSFSRVNPNIASKLHIIYNGYDPDKLSKCDVTPDFLETYQLPEKRSITLGFPHRPQKEKGFLQALRVLKNVKQSYHDVKMLIPMYMDKGKSTRTDETYNQIFRFVEEEDLADNVICHNWILFEDMAEYYSYCDAVLCIGNFVEAFSNVAMESLLCSTPVVCANVATYRTMPIKRYLNIVNYDDIDAACQTVIMLIKNNFNNCSSSVNIDDAISFIKENFSIEKCADGFERVFKEVVSASSAKQTYKIAKRSRKVYRLTAWCSCSDGKIYDDYKGQYIDDCFNGLFNIGSGLLTKEELLSNGIDQKTITNGIREGIIIEDFV